VFPEVCVWILDKRTLMDQASRAGRARAFDTFFEQQRRACAQMLRVRVCGPRIAFCAVELFLG
jgi:hypothetical protein